MLETMLKNTLSRFVFPAFFVFIFNNTTQAAIEIQTSSSAESTALAQNSYHGVAPLDVFSHNFGFVFPNQRVVAEFTVRNTGDEPLTYASAYISGIYFDARHNCAKGLAPKESCRFAISFWPSFEGMYNGRFDLNFKEDYVSVNLFGTSRR